MIVRISLASYVKQHKIPERKLGKFGEPNVFADI